GNGTCLKGLRAADSTQHRQTTTQELHLKNAGRERSLQHRVLQQNWPIAVKGRSNEHREALSHIAEHGSPPLFSFCGRGILVDVAPATAIEDRRRRRLLNRSKEVQRCSTRPARKGRALFSNV